MGDVEGLDKICYPEQWGNWICLVVNMVALVWAIIGVSTDYMVSDKGTISLQTTTTPLEVSYDTHRASGRPAGCPTPWPWTTRPRPTRRWAASSTATATGWRPSRCC